MQRTQSVANLQRKSVAIKKVATDFRCELATDFRCELATDYRCELLFFYFKIMNKL